jgi:hypothetical protein
MKLTISYVEVGVGSNPALGLHSLQPPKQNYADAGTENRCPLLTSKTDIALGPRHVRFTPKSGHS